MWVDLTGATFGRLTVEQWMPGEGWRCRCSCGRTKVTAGAKLRNGSTRSCGCGQPAALRAHYERQVGAP